VPKIHYTPELVPPSDYVEENIGGEGYWLDADF